MARHEPRGQRSLVLAPPVPCCPVCADDRWVSLVDLITHLSRDVPCPVCNRHPDLPAATVTTEPPKDMN
jgi:hypothetical protein